MLKPSHDMSGFVSKRTLCMIDDIRFSCIDDTPMLNKTWHVETRSKHVIWWSIWEVYLDKCRQHAKMISMQLSHVGEKPPKWNRKVHVETQSWYVKFCFKTICFDMYKIMWSKSRFLKQNLTYHDWVSTCTFLFHLGGFSRIV